MADRPYTVAEIDALRSACGDRFLWGTTYWETSRQSQSRSYKEADRAAAVEDMIRTYMVAGVTADDIIAEDRQRGEEYEAQRKEWSEQNPPTPASSATDSSIVTNNDYRPDARSGFIGALAKTFGF